MSSDPLKEYTEAKVEIRASDIHRKDGMDITGNKRGFTDTGTSFFTWFCDRGCVAMKAYDEVANLIKQDLWPDAGRYFVYGNLDDGNKVVLDAIDETSHFTSSLRAFFI
ncbi:NAP1-related protein 1-like [Papaver somniferum]|nr:NAP1-related protein 1-like [Papaver somniferum]